MKPITTFQRGTPKHTAWKYGWWAVAALVLLVVIPFGLDQYLGQFAKATAMALAILGLNLVTGYTGQVSLGHSAFMGVGAYTTVILVTDHDWPLLATIPVAFVLGYGFGFLVGLPALRIKGLYLALITLAIAISFPVVARTLDGLTGGANGKTLERLGPDGLPELGPDFLPIPYKWSAPSWVPGNLSDAQWKYLTILAVAAVFFVLASNLTRSRVGRAMIAVRENQTGAVVQGVNAARVKTAAFAIGAAFASVAGSLFALSANTVTPDFPGGLTTAIQLITGVVLGGVATVSGPVIGGLAVVFLPFWTSGIESSYPNLPKLLSVLVSANVIFGVILIVVMFVAPRGVIYWKRQTEFRLFPVRPKLPVELPPPSAAPPAVEEPEAPAVAVAAGSTQSPQGGAP